MRLFVLIILARDLRYMYPIYIYIYIMLTFDLSE